MRELFVVVLAAMFVVGCFEPELSGDALDSTGDECPGHDITTEAECLEGDDPDICPDALKKAWIPRDGRDGEDVCGVCFNCVINR